MRIESSIDYHDGGLLNYDPARIRAIFFVHFPEAVFDQTNYSRTVLERFFQAVEEKNLEPPQFVIDKKWELAFQNGPTFKYAVPCKENGDFLVTIQRFRVVFDTEKSFSSLNEAKIIDFLKLINYGEIYSDSQTEFFTEKSESKWLLKNNSTGKAQKRWKSQTESG